jgi:pimeloyl-ACP methyl ester carboxylesterase
MAVLGACGGQPSGPTSAPASSPSNASLEPSSPTPSSGEPSASPTAFEAFDVEAGHITIHGSCAGSRPPGAPVVVLSHGIGGDYKDLLVMERHMLEKTMVCGYSRAGVGASDPPAATPRSAADVVVEMRDVLDAAGIRPPYFLVGFSGGGSFAMMLAQAHPDDVVGFVSINPAPPYTRWIERARDVWSPEELQSIEIDWYAGANDEGIDMTGTDSTLTDPLPDTMPYAIMFAEDCGGDVSLCQRLEPPLRETSALLAEVGAGGRFVHVEGAGHDIDLDQPERVKETLDEIWAEAID